MSKAITLTLPHDLGRVEARRRVDEGFGRFAQQMGAASGMLDKNWSGDRLDFVFQALGQRISGSVEIEDAAVRLEVLLPTILAVIADRMRGRLRREGRLLLEKR